MPYLNKLDAVFTILFIIIFGIKVVSSSVLDHDSSNITNTSSLIESKDSCSCHCPPVDCDAAAGSGCFASDTLVTLTNHKRILIQALRPGDQLLTTDGTTIFTTQMMMMLDKNTFSQAMFHTIGTASRHSVSLTPLHLVPIVQNDSTINYVPAKQVKVGDVLYVMSDDQVMMRSSVKKVVIEMKSGYYAPLTTSGTVLVNGIMASCFSNVQSHEAAQWYMGPLRWYHWLAQSLSINEPFGSQHMEGMHIIPKIMYEFGRFFRPTTLRFT